MKLLKVSLAVFCVVGLTAPTFAVTAGQTDDFQDGTTQDWGAGFPHPNPPYAAPNAGPAGIGDWALDVTSNGGFGAGSRMVFFNESADWTGDFTAAGVVAIRADFYVQAPGTSDLYMRVGLDGAGGRWVTTDSVLLPADGAWHTLEFPIEAADLTSVGGIDVAATLAGAVELRILHNTAVDWRGAAIATGIWVDNITAVGASPIGDLDGDGDVDFDDLNILLAAYGTSFGDPGYNADADLDGDGDVDFDDLNILLANYGT